jgi:hypothetical protein
MEFKEPNGPVFSYGDQLRNLATAAAQISPDQWEAGLNNRRGHPLYQKIKETAQQGGFSLYKDIEGGGIKKKSGGKDQFQLSQVHAGVFFPSLLDPESKYCIEANYQIIIPSDIAETTGVGRMYLTVAGTFASGIQTLTASFTANLSAMTWLCNANSASITASLPSASAAYRKMMNIKKIDSSANQVVIKASRPDLLLCS